MIALLTCVYEKVIYITFWSVGNWRYWKYWQFLWWLVSSTRNSWFTSDKQGTLTLSFCVIKPIYEQFFDWNCCVDTGSEDKMWKSVLNSFFHWKNEDISFGDMKYTHFLANSGYFRSFSSPWEECFD